jgi:predicted ATPase/class 3 adenylate cyclase
VWIIIVFVGWDLPSGTVTFLFTDVEGSTKLLQELGARYADALAEHRRKLRALFAEHGGVEVDTQGDAFFVAFRRAQDAAAAAVAAQRELAGGPMRVRMGIHTGEPLVTPEGYAGIDVHRAARIAACGHGGQVLVSQTTRDLVRGFELRELGEHRLKDLTRPERLFQLGEGDFPPVRSLNRVNLPVAATPLIGRRRELAELIELVREARVVTITGAGGSGKTRLALQVAAELVDEFTGGVHFVPLASLGQPELVIAQIVSTVGVPRMEDMKNVQALFVLDNAEHLLAAASDLSALLAAAPAPKLLVTSRAPLRIDGEREYALDVLAPADALAFFTDRARAVRADFVPEPAVEEICARLDRLPLALELAAARLRSLDPPAMLERLGHRLPLLTGGRRDAPERQRTLRATIDWSYGLLASEDQEAFRRLAVFAGSFALAAAEVVADVGLEQLDHLIELSLLKPIRGGRFLMLETVREYARDRLQDRGDEGDLRRRHASFFARLAEESYAKRYDPAARSIRRAEVDYDNLRIALDWAAQNDPPLFVQVAGALGWFWGRTARLVEGRQYLDAALAAGAAPTATHARALAFAGSLRVPRGDVEEGHRLLKAALDLWRELDDRNELASTLIYLGWVHMAYRAHGHEGHDAAARECFEEALRLWQIDRSVQEVEAVNALCMLDIEQGRIDSAEARARAARELALKTGNASVEQMATHYLGDCALIRADYPTAAKRYRRCLELTWEEGAPLQSVAELVGYAMAIAGQGRYEEALRLGGAGSAFRSAAGVRGPVPRFWRQLQEREFGRARRELPPEIADRAWEQGATASLDEAVTWVLGDTAPATRLG